MLPRILYRVRRLWGVLPHPEALRYFGMCIRKTPEFIKSGHLDLTAVDRALSKPVTVRYKGVAIHVDCPKMDKIVEPDSLTFSNVREMYVKDVYLKCFDLSRIKFGTVIDAGANRGLFTIFAAQIAKRVIWIECQKQKYLGALAILREDNHALGEIILVPEFLSGSSRKHRIRLDAMKESEAQSKSTVVKPKFDFQDNLISMSEIIDRYGVERIAFLKMDIEGGEFSVMDDSEAWLKKVDNLAIEVHRQEGNPEEIVKRLEKNGFLIITTDSELHPVSASASSYVYASATGALKRYQRRRVAGDS